MGEIEKAEEIMEEIKKLTPDPVRKIIQDSSYYTYVNEFYYMGYAAFHRKEYPDAVRYLERAVASLKSEHFAIGGNTLHAWYMDTLAEAYQANGDTEKAIEVYEGIQLLTNGRLSYGDIYAKSYYKLGKIFEQKDWKGKAIENYVKFLELWKDADPGLREVEDARLRLAKLQNP